MQKIQPKKTKKNTKPKKSKHTFVVSRRKHSAPRFVFDVLSAGPLFATGTAIATLLSTSAALGSVPLLPRFVVGTYFQFPGKKREKETRKKGRVRKGEGKEERERERKARKRKKGNYLNFFLLFVCLGLDSIIQFNLCKKKGKI